jgi:hypothetical protein
VVSLPNWDEVLLTYIFRWGVQTGCWEDDWSSPEVMRVEMDPTSYLLTTWTSLRPVICLL